MKPTNEQLVARFQAGDEDALTELIERNRGIVYKAMFRVRRQAEQECTEDLLQAGAAAVWRAACKFDPLLGYKFTTLLWCCVSNGLQVEARRHSAIYTPTHVPGHEAQKRNARRLVHIDDRDENGFGLDVEAAFHNTETADGSAEFGEELQLLRWAMTRLPERRRCVLLSRLAGHTLDEVGKQIGITKERVRQIELEAKQATTALVRAQAGMPATKKLTKEERTYIRLVRLTRPAEEIASDLRRSVDAVARLVGSKKWAGRKQAAM